MAFEQENSGFLKYFIQQRSRFKSNLSAAIKTLEPEAIHQYRLSLKRMHAVLNMLNSFSGQGMEMSLLYQPLKSSFKAGGRLRDIHIHLEMLDEFEGETGTDFEKIREFLFFLEAREQKKFRKKVKKSYDISLKRITEAIKIIDRQISGETFNRECVRWIRSELIYLERILPFIHDPRIFHLYRGHQKEASYMIDLMMGFTDVQIEPAYPVEQTKYLARQIGTWHDYQNLFERIRHISTLYNDSRLAISRECRLLIPHLTRRQEQIFLELKGELHNPALYRMTIIPASDQEPSSGPL